MKVSAIIQSNYIPWKGYFDIIRQSDIFILLDCVQSTKNDWRNRNRIKTAQGVTWLTVPVHHSTRLRIDEVEIMDRRWAKKHYRTIAQSYGKAPHFAEQQGELERIYQNCAEMPRLSAVNRAFLEWICTRLAIDTPILDAKDLVDVERLDALSATERLVELCQACRATRYLSGPAARQYLEQDLFSASNIELEFMNYDGYSEYPQLHGPFEHHVSAIDLILMLGVDAACYLSRS